MEYGFIYLWFDREYKRYYLGRHWGTEDDGYICSSNSMRDAFRRRPKDFKRRIISRIFDKEHLVIEEQRWLDMIKKEECGKRYYNKTLKSHMPSMIGRQHTEETKQKMRLAALGKPKSLEHRENIRSANLGKKYSEEVNKKKARTGYKHTEEAKQKMRLHKHSEESKRKMSVARRARSINTLGSKELD